MAGEVGVSGDVDVVFFDVDGTLLDHETAADKAVELLRATYGDVLGALGTEEVRVTWQQLQERWFAEYLDRQLSFVDQRRARVRGLWGRAGAATLTDQQCDTVFATYLAAYEDAWRPYADVDGCLARLGDLPLGVITNGDLEQQHRKALPERILVPALYPALVRGLQGVRHRAFSVTRDWRDSSVIGGLTVRRGQSDLLLV